MATPAPAIDHRHGERRADARSNAWKDRALAFLLGVVVTLGGIWATHVKNAATKDDVAAMINTQGPYVQDRSGIVVRLANIETNLAEIRADLQQERTTRRR